MVATQEVHRRWPDITEGRGRRNAKLAALPLGMAGRAAAGFGKRLAGKDRDEINAELMEKAAEQVFSTLGELKGGAMKVGQALSVMEAAIPDEYGEPFREALVKLQAEAPPLPAKKVHQVLDAQLGTPGADGFSEFSDEPAASASIGQVHRGVWSDGREVAVKIQYPRRRSRAARRPQDPLAAVVDHPADDTRHRRASARRRAHRPHRGRTGLSGRGCQPTRLRRRVRRRSRGVGAQDRRERTQGRGQRVGGRHPLSQVISAGTVEERNTAAAKLAEFEISSPTRVGLLHGDPHPGNFRIHADGRLIVLDYGAVGLYPNGLPAETGPILALARDQKYDELVEAMVDAGFITGANKDRVSAVDIENYLKPYVDPLLSESFHFTRSVAAGGRKGDRSAGRRVQDVAAPERPHRVRDGVPGARRMCRHRRPTRRRGALPSDHGEVGAGTAVLSDHSPRTATPAHAAGLLPLTRR